LVDRGIRSTIAASFAENIEVHSEYLDVSRFQSPEYQQHLAKFLRQKYADRQVGLVIAGLAPALDFALNYRSEIFPGIPLVFCAVDEREVMARKLPSDVIGVPNKFDLTATLDIALRLHPNTAHVYVVAGKAEFDLSWVAEARRVFRGYEERLEFVYLTGLPMNALLSEVDHLPPDSIIYYLHIFEDGAGKPFVPAEALELIGAKANAPIYGNVDTYIGRGLVGGRVFSFEAEGQHAAGLGLRILAGEKPEQLGIQETSENSYMFDWHQLRRWGIGENTLPRGAEIRYQEPDFWDRYRWRVVGAISVCIFEALLIIGLLVQRSSRMRAEKGLRENQRELRVLTGRLLQAQETERRRIARELHDDLSQRLALVCVQLDLLEQKPAESAPQLAAQLHDLSAQVKDLSSSMHDLSRQLHPTKLEQLGLVPALSGLCNELSQSHALRIEFTHHDVPGSIPADTSLCLYRIVQEALRNVVKHSGARHADVELNGGADAICLRIVDDGAGFDTNSIDGKGGLGFAGMRERLRLVRGEIAIDSSPSGGTRVEVHVPISAADSLTLAAPPEERGERSVRGSGESVWKVERTTV
jgi:signal transduction histidine kinase